MKRILPILLTAVIAAAMFTSCEKEFDTPPERIIEDGFVLSISDLRQIAVDSGGYTFTDYYTVYGTAISDGVSGNFFKEFHLQDDSAGIKFTIDDIGIPYRGDYVRVNLRGATVFADNDMIEVTLDDTQANLALIQDTQREVVPKTMTIDELRESLTGPFDERVESQLVRIENVEFSRADLGSTFADAITQNTLNRSLFECDNTDDLILRTSGFASFAGTKLPGGNGTIEGVFTRFGTTPQLLVRGIEDVQFDSLRCDGSTGEEELVLIKDFQDGDLESGGWTQQVVTGTNDWFSGEYQGNGYAEASNFNGGQYGVADIWLVSAPLQLDTVSNPSMSFVTISNFDGPDLRTYVSTDYGDVQDVEDATWTELTGINYSPGGYEATFSGLIDMSNYVSSATYVAFQYTGTTTDGGRRQVDDFSISRRD